MRWQERDVPEVQAVHRCAVCAAGPEHQVVSLDVEGWTVGCVDNLSYVVLPYLRLYAKFTTRGVAVVHHFVVPSGSTSRHRGSSGSTCRSKIRLECPSSEGEWVAENTCKTPGRCVVVGRVFVRVCIEEVEVLDPFNLSLVNSMSERRSHGCR